MAKRLRCKRCFSINVQVIGQESKKFSAGKAIGGAMLAGPLGAAIGGFSGKNAGYDCVCSDCGCRFKHK